MKKLLTSILICVIAISSTFSATVDKKAFDEVYDQLVISNEKVKELTTENSILSNENDALSEELKEKEDYILELKSSFDEVYDQLQVSNTALINSNDINNNLMLSIKESNEELNSSSSLIEELNEDKTFFQFNTLLSTTGIGYSVSIGREILLNTSLILGVNIQDNNIAANIGVLYYL